MLKLLLRHALSAVGNAAAIILVVMATVNAAFLLPPRKAVTYRAVEAALGPPLTPNTAAASLPIDHFR